MKDIIRTNNISFRTFGKKIKTATYLIKTPITVFKTFGVDQKTGQTPPTPLSKSKWCSKWCRQAYTTRVITAKTPLIPPFLPTNIFIQIIKKYTYTRVMLELM